MIWYIVDARLPTEKAHGIQIMNMVKELSGCVDTILMFPERDNKINENLKEFYSLDVEFKVKTIKIIDFFKLISIKKVAFILNKLQFLFFVLLLKFDNDDVVITRQISIAFFLKILFGKKIFSICEIHTWSEKNNWLKKIMLNKIDLVISNSEGTAVAAKMHGVKNVEILINAVDIKYFSNLPSKIDARKKLEYNPSDIIVLYVGHLYARKNVSILIESAKLLPEYKFVIVGGRQQELNELDLKFSEFPSNITLVGQVRHNTVGMYISAADVLVLPNSSNNKESSDYTAPLKLFEYMASKRPIVAANLPSSRAILKNMGYYFIADDANDLANTIEKAINENNEKMLLAAYEFSCQNTWSSRAEKLLSLIKEYEHCNNTKK